MFLIDSRKIARSGINNALPVAVRGGSFPPQGAKLPKVGKYWGALLQWWAILPELIKKCIMRKFICMLFAVVGFLLIISEPSATGVKWFYVMLFKTLAGFACWFVSVKLNSFEK